MAKPEDDGLSPIFEGQGLHAAGLALLLAACAGASRLPQVRQGQLWGIGSVRWLWISIFAAVALQIYVWLCWRLELHGRHLSRLLGRRAFGLYARGFTILGFARIVSVFVLAFVNRGSIADELLSMKIAAVIVLMPALYLFYSVGRYFTFARAFGSDHFDVSVRALPLVREGIFRLTPNAMYVFGFFLLWVPGLWWASAAGLVSGAFNHLYIWLHYYATELPDMRRMYSPRR